MIKLKIALLQFFDVVTICVTTSQQSRPCCLVFPVIPPFLTNITFETVSRLSSF